MLLVFSLTYGEEAGIFPPISTLSSHEMRILENTNMNNMHYVHIYT